MQIDIPAHIEKLLFLRDALIIPGLGGFTATPTAASVDYVGGAVMPPAKTLIFSENLTTDDGILTQDIAQTHGISSEEARTVVTEFTEKTQQLLNQREIVTLPRIGRLYKNYVQKIQFLPDAANFNAESFGLPPLQFSPIARSREVANTPIAPPVASSSSASASVPVSSASLPTTAPMLPSVTTEYAPERRSSGIWTTVLAIFLLLGAIGLGIWYWQHLKMQRLANSNATEQTVIGDKPEKTTRKNKPNTDANPQAVETDLTVPADIPAAEVVAENEKRMQAAREAIEQTAVSGRECVLVVATLQDKNNVDRLEQILQKNGFQVYRFQKSGYQVGIQFRYHQISEVQDKIIQLQQLTGEQNIWIKKK
ncbi:MAG: hypothetical protein ABIO24_09035 [Saprospiraceae bacterium]